MMQPRTDGAIQPPQPMTPAPPSPSSFSLDPGKVPPALLARLLEGRSPAEGEVVGPGVGLDGAVLRLPGRDDGGDARFLVAASDPITFTAEEIGWYAVHVNANDVACMGASPAWFLATVLLQEGAEEATARAIFEQMEEACAQVGAALVGGHTEVAPHLDRPMVAGTMLGVTDRWISAAGARPGDALLLTKGAGVEGTAILVRSLEEELRPTVGADMLDRGRRFLQEPGLSVVEDVTTALAAGRPRALHDPTEGGVAGGIYELCEASGTGARLDRAAIRILDETRAVCQALELDPLGLLGSGALLVAASEDDVQPIVEALTDQGIAAARIGTLVDETEGVTIRDADGEVVPLRNFDADEITRVL